MDQEQEQEATTSEVFREGYLLGRREAIRDLELLQAAELEGEYQAMLAERRALPAIVNAILEADPEIMVTVNDLEDGIDANYESWMQQCVPCGPDGMTQADLELNTTGGRWK